MQDLVIYGEGKGGGYTPVEADDTLKSVQTMRLLFALSEGEIESVEDILVNSASFSNFTNKVAVYEVRKGTIDQDTIKGFSAVEAPIESIGTLPAELKHGVEKIYTVLGQYDAVRITLSIDRLEQVTDQGDRVGYETTVSIYKRRKDKGDNWSLCIDSTKKGKCTNPYAWDIRVDKPSTTIFSEAWEVKIVRLSADDTSDKYMSKTFLSNIITITEAIHGVTYNYPKTALVGVTIYDAKTFGSSIPEIKFKVKGIKLLLPSNYNASGRTYNETSPWDGSFKSYTEYTDNLAWVLYWSLRNSDWGLGIPAADIDLGSFYSFAKHCDELVPAGAGTEPRYTVHISFMERENVPSYLMKLLTLGNANFSSNDFGQIKVIWDGAGQAITKVVSNSTVIDGMFDYTSNDLEGRTNLVNVTYARDDFFGDSDTATWYEDSLITRYGLQTSDVILLGCKSEYQALRKAKWTLYNNCYSGDMITFKQLFNGSHYQIGELVSVMDSDNVSLNARHAIVKSSSLSAGVTSIVLDRDLILANSSYTVEFLGIDGTTFISKTILQSNGTFGTITFNGTEVPFVGGTILFKTDSLAPRVVKVIKIEKDDSHIYTITGLTHHEDKYNYIDSTGTIIQPSSTGNYVNFGNFSVPPVTNLLIEQVHVSNGTLDYSKLAVSWNWSAGSTGTNYKPTFEVSYRRDSQDFTQIKDLKTTNFDIDYPVPGVYEVYVWAVNPFSGIKSAVTTTINPYNYRVSAAQSSLLPPENVVVPNTVGVVFTQPDLNLVWSFPAANYTKDDKLKDYVVQILDLARNIKGTYVIQPNVNRGGDFILSFAENSTIFGTPTREFLVRVYSRDIIGDLSNYVEVQPINAIPGIQSFSVLSGVSSVFVKINTVPEVDIKGYQVWRSKTQNFTKDSSTLAYDGADTYITLNVPTSETYYYAVAAYDSFGKTGLAISGEQSSTPTSADATTWTKTGLQFSVDPLTANRLKWTAGTIVKNASVTYTISAGYVDWTMGFIYVYFDPTKSQIVLQTTPTLMIAVGLGCYPLATYTGGDASNIKGGDGNAFISGSQIIAGTVGASEIKTGSINANHISSTDLVIEHTANIKEGIITNALIGEFIQSNNYSPTARTGWKADKAGNITTYGSLGLLDTDGNVVFAGGKFDWANAKGNGVPAINATRNVYNGLYSSSTSYVIGDIIVTTEGNSWVCKQATTGNAPPSLSSGTSIYWGLLAAKGDVGLTASLFGIDNAAVVFSKNTAGVISPSAGVTLVTSYQNVTGTITYQWQKNGANIAGATASSYTVPTSDFSSVISNTYKCTLTGVLNGVSGTLSDSITIPLLIDGGSSPQVILSNENFTFGAQNTGFTGISFTNGTCDVTAYIGSTQLAYATNGPNTFSVTQTVTGATVATGSNPYTKIFRIPAPTDMSAESALVTLTITIRGNDGVAFPDLIVKTIRYNLSRMGATGSSYWLTTTNFLRRTAGLAYVPTVLTANGYAATGSTAPALYSARFKVYEDGGATAKYSSAVDENTLNYTPSSNSVNTIKVEMYLAGGFTTLVDWNSIPIVQDGSATVSVAKSNDSVLLAADSNGNVNSYAGSGTTIQVLEGSTLLTFTTGVASRGQFTVNTPSVTAGTITPGTVSGSGTTTYTIGQHSELSSDSAVITYTINIVKLDGTAVTLTEAQTIAKSKAGTVGVSTYPATVYYNGVTSTPPSGGSYNFTNNTLSVPADWSAVPYPSTTTGTSVSTQTFTSSNGGVSTGWSTPVLYSKNGTDGQPGVTTTNNITTTNTVVAPTVTITGEQIFNYPAGATTPSNTSVTLTAFLTGNLTTYSWEYWNGSVWTALSGTATSQTYTLAYNNAAFTAASLRVRCSSGGYYAEMAVVKVSSGTNGVDGKNSVVGQLSSDAIVIACDSNGTPVSGAFTAAVITMSIMNGGVDDSTNWSVAITTDGNCTVTTSTRTASVTGFAGTTAYIQFVASRTGYSNITKRCLLSKSLAGTPGIAGGGKSYQGSGAPSTATVPNPQDGDNYFDYTNNLIYIYKGASSGTPATNMEVGQTYTIATVGTTDFTAYGASSNTVGHTFVCTQWQPRGTVYPTGKPTQIISALAIKSGVIYTISTTTGTYYPVVGAPAISAGSQFLATSDGSMALIGTGIVNRNVGWKKVMPQITSGNKSTYISDAAIGNAQIGSAAIGVAQIIDASVETLKIKGDAVTIPYGYSLPAAVTMAATNTWVTKGTITITATDSPDVDLLAMILYGASASGYPGVNSAPQVDMRLTINGTVQKPADTSVMLPPVGGTFYRGSASSGIKFTATKGTAYTINIQIRVGGNSITLENTYITAIGVKR